MKPEAEAAALRKCDLDAQARQMPKEDSRREVEKELTGKDSEPSELIYFKVYKSQIPVIEQTIETAALMLGGPTNHGAIVWS